MIDKICPICGIIYSSSISRQICCSTSCRSKKIRAETNYNKKCIFCGKEYIAKAANSIYCSNRCMLDSIKIKPKKENCKWCGNTYMKFKGGLYCSSECKRLSKQYIRKVKRSLDIELRISDYLRHYLYRAVKGKQYNSKYYLDYTVKELMDHLEALFIPGMSWNNYGEWHIDHIRPLVSFDFIDENGNQNIEEIQKSMALSNLQPLWAHDNISKGGKYTPKLEDKP